MRESIAGTYSKITMKFQSLRKCLIEFLNALACVLMQPWNYAYTLEKENWLQEKLSVKN